MMMRSLFAVAVILSATANAQEIDGSSHLTWSSSTGYLTGLGYTSVDGLMGDYYTSYVRSQITDENGVILISGSATDTTGSGGVGVSVRAPGSPGHNYFMTSFHHAIEGYSSCPGGLSPTNLSTTTTCTTTTYVDYYNFYDGVLPGFWSDFGTAEFPNSWYWLGPGPNSYAPVRSLTIAETYSNAQLRTPVLCGDARDTIATQYVTFAAPWLPACTSFGTGISTGHYTFAQLNYPSPATAPAEFSWALFTLSFLNGVDSWGTDFNLAYGYVPHINSGYRDPNQNKAARGVAGSRHMAGIAADMRNVTYDVTGRNHLIAAVHTHTPNAWIEDIKNECGLACVHADWRNFPLTWVH